MVTPEEWRRPDGWKYGPTKLVVSERPDPIQLPETGDMSSEDVDRRIAKLIGAAIVLGAILLVIREAVS